MAIVTTTASNRHPNLAINLASYDRQMISQPKVASPSWEPSSTDGVDTLGGVDGLLAYGNAAKLYCLTRIAELAAARETLAVVDLGCGAGTNFVALLRRWPNVRYMGVDPDLEACTRARENLAGLEATIIHAPAYGLELGPADVVASFSVLEHVYHRSAYLECAAASLVSDGVAFVNYDAGHFVAGSSRDRVKTLVGGVLARAGRERWYQSFVAEEQFRRLVARAELRIVEAKFFNTATLKELYGKLPPESRDRFMQEWLEFELGLNDLGLAYEDALAPLLRTRNFVLART